MLDPELIEQLAGALGTEAGLIEKDWHVTRALGVLATIQHDQICLLYTSPSPRDGLLSRMPSSA